MNTFKKKEKGEEAKFAKEEELKFKFISRRNKLFSQWASSLMNKNTEDTSDYAMSVISLYIDKPDAQNIIYKVFNDLVSNNINITIVEVKNKFEECFEVAKNQLMGE